MAKCCMPKLYSRQLLHAMHGLIRAIRDSAVLSLGSSGRALFRLSTVERQCLAVCSTHGYQILGS
jgi:hypothetical protein